MHQTAIKNLLFQLSAIVTEGRSVARTLEGVEGVDGVEGIEGVPPEADRLNRGQELELELIRAGG